MSEWTVRQAFAIKVRVCEDITVKDYVGHFSSLVLMPTGNAYKPGWELQCKRQASESLWANPEKENPAPWSNSWPWHLLACLRPTYEIGQNFRTRGAEMVSPPCPSSSQFICLSLILRWCCYYVVAVNKNDWQDHFPWALLNTSLRVLGRNKTRKIAGFRSRGDEEIMLLLSNLSRKESLQVKKMAPPFSCIR